MANPTFLEAEKTVARTGLKTPALIPGHSDKKRPEHLFICTKNAAAKRLDQNLRYNILF